MGQNTVVLLGCGDVGPIHEPIVRRPDVQAIMKRVVITPDDEDPARPGFAAHDQVTIETSEGDLLQTGHPTKVRGGPDLPLNRDELWAKFEDCVKAGGSRAPARKLFDALMSLDRLPHIQELPGLAASRAG